MRKPFSFMAVFTIFTVIISMLFTMPKTAVLAAGTTYYIDTAGDNSSNGTSPETPWADFTNINSRILSTGDRILLKRGCTFKAKKSVFYWCLISGSGVTVDAYGTGANPILDGNGFEGCAFYFQNQDNLTFQNLSFYNMSILAQTLYTTYNHSGLTFRNIYMNNSEISLKNTAPDKSGGTLLKDVVFDGVKSENTIGLYYGGIVLYTMLSGDSLPSTSAASMKNIFIHNVDLSSNHLGLMAIANCEDVTLSGVKLYNSSVDYAATGTTAVFVYKTKNIRFINCMITDTANTGSNDQCGIDNEYANDASIFRGCYISGNAGPGIEYLSLAERPGDFSINHVVNNCTFVNNGKAGTWMRGSLYRLDCSGKHPEFNGVASDNIFAEIISPGNTNAGFTYQAVDGNFEKWKFSNNSIISNADYVNNSGKDYIGAYGKSKWKYQSYNGSAWSDMPFSKSLNKYGSSKNNIDRFEILPENNSAHWTARVFTVPYSGGVQISGWAHMPYGDSGGNGVIVRISRNGKTIFDKTISGTDKDGLPTNLNNILIDKGDIIRFEVNCGSSNNNNFDQLSWIPTVAYRFTDDSPSTTSSSSSLSSVNSVNPSNPGTSKEGSSQNTESTSISDVSGVSSSGSEVASKWISEVSGNISQGDGISDSQSDLTGSIGSDTSETGGTNKNNTIVIIFAIIAVLLIASVGGIFLFKNKSRS
ncbi:MAG: right-handed parallel beta-helix repeat-containing protein [Saccharofermentanales bacterium]